MFQSSTFSRLVSHSSCTNYVSFSLFFGGRMEREQWENRQQSSKGKKNEWEKRKEITSHNHFLTLRFINSQRLIFSLVGLESTRAIAKPRDSSKLFHPALIKHRRVIEANRKRNETHTELDDENRDETRKFFVSLFFAAPPRVLHFDIMKRFLSYSSHSFLAYSLCAIVIIIEESVEQGNAKEI